jgi:hypothetical protein
MKDPLFHSMFEYSQTIAKIAASKRVRWPDIFYLEDLRRKMYPYQCVHFIDGKDALLLYTQKATLLSLVTVISHRRKIRWKYDVLGRALSRLSTLCLYSCDVDVIRDIARQSAELRALEGYRGYARLKEQLENYQVLYDLFTKAYPVSAAAQN